jgi:uncharacterized protein YraI
MASSNLRLAVGAILFSISCAAMAENAVTTQVASVRAGPDDSYPEVAQLDADSPIQVMGCLDDWSWCDVTFEGNRGWMYSPDITYEYEGGYVPFYSYAPAFSVPVVTFTVDAYWGRYYHDRPWYRERDQWAHRVIEHRPPPGPPPHRGPPPREVVSRDRPHGGPPGDHAIRLGSANRPSEHVPPPPHAPPSLGDHPDDHRAPDRPDVGHRDDQRADRADMDHHADRSAPERAGSDHRADHPGPGRTDADHRAAERVEADHRADHPGPGTAAPERAAPEHREPPHSAPPPHPAPEHPAPQAREHHEEPPH